MLEASLVVQLSFKIKAVYFCYLTKVSIHTCILKCKGRLSWVLFLIACVKKLALEESAFR